MRNVTILGGGNGARSAAAEIALRGHKVTIYEMPQFADSVSKIKENKIIKSIGEIEGNATIEKVTFDINEAVTGSDVIIIIVPTIFHLAYTRLLAPVLEDGHNIVFMPGSMGSLEFIQEMQCQGISKDITVSDFAALPYATRIISPDTVKIFGRRAVLSMGVFPAVKKERIMPIMRDVYPGIETMRDVLEAGLSNPNPTLHCLGILLNAGRIEYSHGEFYYYEEGLTPGVCNAVEKIDQERVNIGKALGLNLLSLIDTYPIMKYGPKGENFWQVIRGVKPLMGVKGPAELDNRYLTEDVPIGLLCYSQIGKQLGVNVKLMESVIHIAEAVLDRNFSKTGRTLEVCGILGMDADQLVQYVKTGDK
ncbi:MAG: NAD/NADP octopine/nopaline dehydrogenase family protein [Deltaproteobacteria bacterium]|jgi:opine dehydrogenase|nr:NAD/NADP octopine/nopaline dehydrogenase family protein [Deltaproteobacteria bacterium]